MGTVHEWMPYDRHLATIYREGGGLHGYWDQVNLLRAHYWACDAVREGVPCIDRGIPEGFPEFKQRVERVARANERPKRGRKQEKELIMKGFLPSWAKMIVAGLMAVVGAGAASGQLASDTALWVLGVLGALGSTPTQVKKDEIQPASR